MAYMHVPKCTYVPGLSGKLVCQSCNAFVVNILL